MKGKSAVKVKMFGVFSAEYQGKNLLGAAAKDSEFVYLVQLLWFFRDRGIDRNLMLETLFGERQPEDIGHALRCAVYHAKCRLKNLGFPDVKFIIKKGGSYYWNDEIPLETDVQRFDSLLERASRETDREERCRLLLEAGYLYQGEFLKDYTGGWVVYEAHTYRERFRHCVEEAAALLREEKDYVRLEELGNHALEMDPYANWELLTMESLCALGQRKEAEDFYIKTQERYQKNYGISPSPDLKNYLKQLEEGPRSTYRTLEGIQESMKEEPAEGGYVCSSAVFLSIYQMLQRVSERGGQSLCLMMCNVQDANGQPLPEQDALEKNQNELVQILRLSVRRGDILCRYSRDVFLLLLVNTCLEDCGLVQRRIDKALRKQGLPFCLKYSMNNVVSLNG